MATHERFFVKGNAFVRLITASGANHYHYYGRGTFARWYYYNEDGQWYMRCSLYGGRVKVDGPVDVTAPGWEEVAQAPEWFHCRIY